MTCGPVTPSPTAPPDAGLARRFRVAWGFLLGSVLIGLGLRLQWVRPWTSLGYNDLLHAHSHVAFLGWPLPWPLLIASAVLVAGVALLYPRIPDPPKA